MKIITSIQDWKEFRKSLSPEKSLGFVPTMGALHEGHLSLVKQSVNENDVTVVSIFVNPTQFNDPKDLENYPRDIDKDIRQLSELVVDMVLIPEPQEIYVDDFRYKITESDFSLVMEGKHRPGHFDGVLTVVMKLLNLVNPTRAYFGEKDYQQLQLIRDMVASFFMDVNVVKCPTVRETDGLAMSSRNSLLTKEDRGKAPNFSKALLSSKSLDEIKTDLTTAGFNVEYIEDVNRRRFGAVKLGKVRLIDNVKR